MIIETQNKNCTEICKWVQKELRSAEKWIEIDQLG